MRNRSELHDFVALRVLEFQTWIPMYQRDGSRNYEKQQQWQKNWTNREKALNAMQIEKKQQKC